MSGGGINKLYNRLSNDSDDRVWQFFRDRHRHRLAASLSEPLIRCIFHHTGALEVDSTLRRHFVRVFPFPPLPSLAWRSSRALVLRLVYFFSSSALISLQGVTAVCEQCSSRYDDRHKSSAPKVDMTIVDSHGEGETDPSFQANSFVFLCAS